MGKTVANHTGVYLRNTVLEKYDSDAMSQITFKSKKPMKN